MNVEITPKMIEEAYKIWSHNHKLYFVESEQKRLSDLHSIKDSQLRRARKNLRISSSEIAEKLKVSTRAIRKAEEQEIRGTVTLKTLSEVAEVMGCELVYSIRPKANKEFAQVIWEKILPKVLQNRFVQVREAMWKARLMAGIAGIEFEKRYIVNKFL